MAPNSEPHTASLQTQRRRGRKCSSLPPSVALHAVAQPPGPRPALAASVAEIQRDSLPVYRSLAGSAAEVCDGLGIAEPRGGRGLLRGLELSPSLLAVPRPRTTDMCHDWHEN